MKNKIERDVKYINHFIHVFIVFLGLLVFTLGWGIDTNKIGILRYSLTWISGYILFRISTIFIKRA